MQPMAIKAITYVIDHAPKDIKPAKLLVLMMLADSAGGDDWSCYPSTRYLSEKARVDQRYGKQLLQELVTDGLIEIERFGGMKTDSGFTNRYYVLCNGRRFNETGAPQLTGGNYSAPQGVNQGSPKPSVKPVDHDQDDDPKPTAQQQAVGILARFYEARSHQMLGGYTRRELDKIAEDFTLAEIERAILAVGDKELERPFQYLRKVLSNTQLTAAPAQPSAPAGFWGREFTE
jgi:hypothetical protein